MLSWLSVLSQIHTQDKTKTFVLRKTKFYKFNIIFENL